MAINMGTLVRVVSVALCSFVLAVSAAAQGEKTRPSLTGKYEGTAKSGNDELKLTLDLIDKDGVFGGTVTSQFGTFKIVKANLVDNQLTLETEGSGTTGRFSLRVNGDKFTGTLTSKGGEGAVELHKVVIDEISGQWDAMADAQGQPFPFILTLKLDGEKVTGSSSSQLGESAISSGSWKDGKLSVQMEGGAGQITLVAIMLEGKLSGDYDFAGQLSGKWVAMRKK